MQDVDVSSATKKQWRRSESELIDDLDGNFMPITARGDTVNFMGQLPSREGFAQPIEALL